MDEKTGMQDRKEEIIDGIIVTMPPATVNHNRVSANISTIFHDFLRGQSSEYFYHSFLSLSEDEDEYIPDGMVVCDPAKVRDNGVYGMPWWRSFRAPSLT